MAAAIRLAAMGHRVTVFEKNDYAGGKLSTLKLGNYRFDKGPSLLTMPELIDELPCLQNNIESFRYFKLKTITHYFFEDGTRVVANDSTQDFANELSEKLGEDKASVLEYLKRSEFYYNTVGDLFLKQSISQLRSFTNFKTLRALFRLSRLNLFSTMNGRNKKQFRNSKTTQLFNRYATYNGSNPYKAPALLNIIPHLEFGLGAYLPEKGMHDITKHLYKKAIGCGVKFCFGETVEKIEVSNGAVAGIVSNGMFHQSDLVLSDADIHVVYKKLLPRGYSPKYILNQEKSSSAYVFYWGIKKQFQQLDLHNILFSENYEEEFEYIFGQNKPSSDPTIYINISSKFCKDDAPAGCENWFVMVNVPHNKTSNDIEYAAELRKNVISKINRMLKVDIESLIEEESTLNPIDIEKQTSSFGGSLYGNASNNKFSAFLRHSNYSNKIKGLFLCGGSVHPGGGIPLCLYSAKIVADLIKQKTNA